ncbi:MAG: prepilin-type N-terminal cleavage/methylation domain-containing protein [Candidatus Omnitrophica bacterium]|nr:prepilin-type N-terminal cleavage/methylation domain-containing protein [Candidatus Omnitrophota bacterium]
MMMPSIRRYNEKAFTLIEVAVVLFIFTIVVGASYALMNSGRIGWNSGTTKIELQEDIRQAMDEVIADLSESSPLRSVIGAGGASVTFQMPVDQNGTGTWEDADGDATLDFYLQNTLDATGNIRWGAYLRRENASVAGTRTGRSAIYLLVATATNTEIRRRVVNSAGVIIEDIAICDDIQALNFTRTSNDVITATITGNKVTNDQYPINYSVTTAVYLRNSD